MKAQPIETIPTDRKILAKHKWYGWIQVMYWVRDHWGNEQLDRLFCKENLEAWAELPEEQK